VGSLGEASVRQSQRRNDARLTALLAEVNRSRIRVRVQRDLMMTSQNRNELAQCYDALADALEAYADEASESGVPLPYQIRDELRLYRSMGQGRRS
jgi:hypothetical protein